MSGTRWATWSNLTADTVVRSRVRPFTPRPFGRGRPPSAREDHTHFAGPYHIRGPVAATVRGVVARVVSPAVLGLETQTVQVEVDLRAGLPAFAVVGLPDAAVQEARERVRSGLVNQAFALPARRIVVNLAPADLRKAGPQYDLPIALAILAASGQLAAEALDGAGAMGELALDGSLRPVTGVLAMCEHAST